MEKIAIGKIIKNKKSKENIDISNKNNEDNDILIRSLHDISTSKINNSRHDNKIEINIRKLSEKEKINAKT